MKTSLILMGVLLLLQTGFGNAQKDSTHRKPFNFALPSHNLGGAVGNTSGTGLAYRKWFANGMGFQVAGFPYLHKSDNKSSVDLNLGVLGLKSFFNTNNTPFSKTGIFSANIYGYAGGSMRYVYEEYERTRSTSIEELRRYALGSGFGFDFGIWRFKWTLMFGLGAEYADSQGRWSYEYEEGVSYQLIPSAGTGLFFGF